MSTIETKPKLYELDGPVSPKISTFIPKRIIGGLENYVWYGTPTGGFLRAVLTNDLQGAINRGDPESMRVLREICQYVYNYVPSLIHGSDEAVSAHIKMGSES